jgi:hypothetical protein
LARKLAFLTNKFRSFLQSLQANTGIASQIRPRLFPSTYIPIHYSLIIITLEAISMSYWAILLISLPLRIKLSGLFPFRINYEITDLTDNW